MKLQERQGITIRNFRGRAPQGIMNCFEARNPAIQNLFQEEYEMSFSLPSLPYAENALEPYISAETLQYHHGKHHNKYVSNLNGFVEGTDDEHKPLEEIIMSAEGGLFNNAAQTWNHTFFWQCMKPGGGGQPSGELKEALERDFGSFDAFAQQFKEAALTQFGSGWAWLLLDGSKLAIAKTLNADLPMRHNQRALLTIDVWEHAYYIDYRNNRGAFVDAFLKNLVNWDFVARNFKDAS